jgi:hypothetical protein
VTSEELGCVLKLEGGERDEPGPKREGKEGPSLELNGRGDCGGFGFNSGGTDMPPAIRLGQGPRGARRGHCVVQFKEERGKGVGGPRLVMWNVRHTTEWGLDETAKGKGVYRRSTAPKPVETGGGSDRP